MSTAKDTQETMARHPFVAQFIDQGRARPTEGLTDWWSELRTSALQNLVGLDVPGKKDEAWRFIKLDPIVDRTWLAEADAAFDISESDVENRRLVESEEATLVFANGQFAPELSNVGDLTDGVRVTTWSELRDAGELEVIEDHVDITDFWDDDVFYNLNSANFEDGAVVVVDDKTVVDTPIHILHIGSAEPGEYAAHPRNVIVAGQSAEVTIIEEFASTGDGTYFHNVVDEVSLAPNSHVRHVKVQRDSDQSFHVARNQITLERDSNYLATAVNLGAALSRNDSYARFDGKNIECTLDGLGFISGDQVTDTHTALDHQLSDSESYQLQKNIVDDRAHSVFNGKIFVRQDAQRIDSNQLNQNLLLSPRAQVDTKPQLEIFADDVVCSHGATVGQLEEKHFFYLMARGLDPERARALLTYAFAAEILEDIEVDSLRTELEDLIMEQTTN